MSGFPQLSHKADLNPLRIRSSHSSLSLNGLAMHPLQRRHPRLAQMAMADSNCVVNVLDLDPADLRVQGNNPGPVIRLFVSPFIPRGLTEDTTVEGW